MGIKRESERDGMGIERYKERERERESTSE